MFKMLIVEDERWEREGLIDFLDWNEMGIEICGVACDGIEGLELVINLQPDIIITDIKMLELDGIEMSKKIRTIMPYVKIIIITGYDDFKFAQQAIKFNASAYLLKPITKDETIEAIQTVVKECEKEAKVRQSLKALVNDNSLISEDRFKLDLFEGSVELNSITIKNINCDIKLKNDDIIAIVIKTNYSEKLELIKLKIKDIEELVDTPSIIVKSETHKLEIFLCLSLEGKSEKFLLKKVNQIYKLIVDRYNNKPIIGIGSMYKGISYIHKSCNEAMQGVEYKTFWGDTGIIKYDEVQCIKKVFSDINREYLIQISNVSKQILHNVVYFNSEEVYKLLNELFTYLSVKKGAEWELIYNYFYGLINETSLFHLNLNENLNDVYEDDSLWKKKLSALENIQEFKDFIFDFYERYFRWTSEKRNNKNERILQKVIQLIEKKYMDEVSLKTISDEVFLSPNYIGNIFKKTAGKSFNSYLSEFRMEKAKEYLKLPDNKVEKVALMVGIYNVSYFCLIFRKTYGLSPGEYQERIVRG